MDTNQATRSFLEPWRAQWPEWALAEVFVPIAQRDVAVAWFALLKVFADAAWDGADPTPGLAKLAWWQEELRGWAKGARRHPLGELLQPQPAPWQALADAMSVLRHRELPRDPTDALLKLRDFDAAVCGIETALFGTTAGSTATTIAMLAPAALEHAGAAAASHLQTTTQVRSPHSRPARLLAAVVRLRLADAARTGQWRPAGRWRSLWALWGAARN